MPTALSPDRSERRTERWIFIAMLAVRLLYLAATASMDLDLDRDTARYEEQSDAILRGDVDLETPLFITAPFYSFAQAAFKWAFGSAWKWGIGIAQLLLCCLSGVYLYRIAKLLFDRRVARLSAAAYVVFPLTLVWVNARAQDMPFQIALIFALYAILRTMQRDDLRWTMAAAALFAVAFLTKSHLLLFAPFIPLIWWLGRGPKAGRKLAHTAVFAATCFAFTLPYGLYNLHRHGLYVLSSTGQGGHFLTGHNDDVYRFIVDPPPLGSPEHTRILKMDYLVLRELQNSLATLDHRCKQHLYQQKGLDWCRANPGKLVKLSLYDLYYFLLPGVNYHHYGFGGWLALFLLSLPVYGLASIGIIRALRADPRTHFWILGLLLSMVVFSVGFYVQNRFRTITLEPYYLIYASSTAVWLGDRSGLFRRWPRLARLLG
ncbi:MAG: glycosyltransferase family 39 protein [Bacteroidetes bacterium]|nr:glycosyltransferase family 39 protein [Bacteroidota bacterium]